MGEFVGVELPYSDEDEMEERVNTLVPFELDEVTVSTVSVSLVSRQLLRFSSRILLFFVMPVVRISGYLRSTLWLTPWPFSPCGMYGSRAEPDLID